MVMELCEGSSIASNLPYTEDEASKILSKLLSALKYMVSPSVGLLFGWVLECSSVDVFVNSFDSFLFPIPSTTMAYRYVSFVNQSTNVAV